MFFFSLFRVCVKDRPGGHFGEDFCGFLQICGDFGYPLGILFGIIFLKKRDPKCVCFLESILARFFGTAVYRLSPRTGLLGTVVVLKI